MEALSKQNVYASWIRNGLITTVVGLAFIGVERLFSSEKRKAFKILGIYILSIAATIFIFSTLMSQGVLSNMDNYYYLFGYALFFALICIIIGVIVTY